jgi:hypothetical protein
MGDMADLYNYWFDDDDFEPEAPPSVTCRYCHRGPFWWLEDDNDDWRLVTATGKVHSCKAYKR